MLMTPELAWDFIGGLVYTFQKRLRSPASYGMERTERSTLVQDTSPLDTVVLLGILLIFVVFAVAGGVITHFLSA
jgi:hypothetical protein